MKKPSFTYRVTTGEFLVDTDVIAVGYSGQPGFKNNPAYEHVAGAGPIPRGPYYVGQAYNSKRVGPLAIPLRAAGHDACGRSAFLIHGDSKTAPGYASRGCIILPRSARETIIGLTRLWRGLELHVI